MKEDIGDTSRSSTHEHRHKLVKEVRYDGNTISHKLRSKLIKEMRDDNDGTLLS